MKNFTKAFVSLMLLATIAIPGVFASSHSEAPLTARDRFADNTDTYAFRSIEKGREDFVTLIANYIPFQQPSAGPHFFRWDDTVLYEIKIDNTGDGMEDVVYQFQFTTHVRNGDTVLGQGAVNQDAIINSLDDPDYNEPQTYVLTRVDKKTGKSMVLLAKGIVPPANIGMKVTPNYEDSLGMKAIHHLKSGGKVFAGQRDEGFYIDVGGVFDGLNLKSIGFNGGYDYTKGFNVSSIALEVPIKELTSSGKMPKKPTDKDAVIGVWATASRKATTVIHPDGTRVMEGEWRQISRLGNPLVNEVVIPLKLKDAFNSLSPVNDAVAAPVVLDPELPKIMKAVFGINIPSAPRNDLVSIFATGIPVNPITGPNYTTFLSDGKPHEYLRLNVAIPVTPFDKINRLGLLGGDVAGFPNGRRVQDDVTDIALRAVAGGTPFTPDTNVAPNNTLGDGVSENDVPYLNRFPYLAPPNAGNSGM
jgi:Domain of unknown function (DUF4331)